MKALFATAVSAALLLALLLLRAAPTSDPQSASPSRFVILDANLFDGERWWPKASVQVADGRIEAVAEQLSPPDGYAVVDADGRTLLPGLIDAHVHTWGNARRDALRFGVTTLLDMFTAPDALASARVEREGLQPTVQADLWSAGMLATADGGHGTQFGTIVPTLSQPSEAFASTASRSTCRRTRPPPTARP